jgi:hypothetical protein
VNTTQCEKFTHRNLKKPKKKNLLHRGEKKQPDHWFVAALPFPDRYYTGAAYAGLSATSPGNVDSLKSSSLGLLLR